MVADITMFDPKTVTDHSTFAKGTLPSTGIPHVIVNGIIVMKDSEPIKRFDAGQPIRFEVQKKGRMCQRMKWMTVLVSAVLKRRRAARFSKIS